MVIKVGCEMRNNPESESSHQVLRKMAVLSPSSMHRRVKEQRKKVFAEMVHQPSGNQLAADQRFSTTLGVFRAFGMVGPSASDINDFETAYRKKEFQVAQADADEKRRLVGLAMDYSVSSHPNAVIVNIFLDTVAEMSIQKNSRADEVALMTRTAVALLEENTPR